MSSGVGGFPAIHVKPEDPRTTREQAWLSDALDAVVELSRSMAGDAVSDYTPVDVFNATKPVLRRLAEFQTLAFLSLDSDGLSFDVEDVDPIASAELLRREMAHLIEDGTFAWSLYQNRPVIVPGHFVGPWVLLHVLATPKRVIGMFFGALPSHSAFIPDAAQKIISMVLFNSASVMESGSLYRQLTQYTQNLEQVVEERTRELRRSEEEARLASKAKSEFLANMSHEIRTPINGIVGMNSLMLAGGLDGEMKDQAETIQRSADNLLAIINDILDFSKIEAGRLTLEEVPFDLHQAVEDVAELLAPKAYEKGLELIVQYASDAPRGIWGDSGRLRQVLINLVGNAIKFTSEGHVLIDISWSASDRGAARFRLAVEDTGIGVSHEKLDKIFEKFTQADSSTTRNYGGTGLGLSISRELSELMGGELSAESHVGVGSTFAIDLPAKLAEEIDPAPRLAQPRSVLVITPSDSLRKSLHAKLQSMGADVVSVPRLEALKTRVAFDTQLHFDVGLIDIGLGPYDLRSVVQWSGQTGLARTMDLAVMAPMGLRDEATLYLGDGFKSVFLKPVREKRLIDLLHVDMKRAPDIQPPNPHPARAAISARVLLVEDEPVNRKVAGTMLERLGHQVEIAENGEIAVDRILSNEPGHYQVVLMDCQMPVLDGFEATRRIRRAENQGPHHQVIVALTASALESDQEKCRACGMDDFLAKPIRLEDLSAIVDKWSGRGDEDIVELEVASGPAPTAFDLKGALKTVGGDEELLWTIVDLFLEGWTELSPRLDEALVDASAEDLRAVTHRLSGSAANVGAIEVRRVAAELEPKFANGDLTAAVEGVASLKGAMEAFQREIEPLRPSPHLLQ